MKTRQPGIEPALVSRDLGQSCNLFAEVKQQKDAVWVWSGLWLEDLSCYSLVNAQCIAQSITAREEHV